MPENGREQPESLADGEPGFLGTRGSRYGVRELAPAFGEGACSRLTPPRVDVGGSKLPRPKRWLATALHMGWQQHSAARFAGTSRRAPLACARRGAALIRPARLLADPSNLLVPALLGLANPAWGATPRQPDRLGPLILLAWLPAALLIFVALEVVLWVLVPGPLLATGRAIERGRGRCLLTGLLTAGITVALLALSSRFPAVGQALIPIVLGIVALGSLTGVTAITALLGQGALDLAERSGSRASAVVAGSLLFGLVLLFPIVGQVLALYFWLVGLGGALQALAGASARGK